MTIAVEKRKRLPRKSSGANSEPPPPPRDWLAEYATKAKLHPSEVDSLRGWLAEQLVADEFAKLGQGGHAETQVPLRRVFIDLPTTKHPAAEPTDGLAREFFLGRLRISKPLSLSRLCHPSELSGAESMQASDVQTSMAEDGLADAVPRGRKRLPRADSAGTLLIGGPGQGKSTLGQLACQLHRVALLRAGLAELPSNVRDVLSPFEEAELADLPAAPTERLSLPDEPLFPLRVVLPDAAAWLAKQPESHGSDTKIPALLQFLASQPSARKAKLQAETLAALITDMPFLLLLDGFDEVGAVEDRERIVTVTREMLTELGKTNARAIVVATTRPQGYAGELSRIGIRLTTKYLAQLSTDDALKYATKLVQAKIQGADEQAKMLERLRAASQEKATSRLLRTPLQVTILAALVQQQGRAPSERWKLFGSYFDFTYRREVERDTYASALLANRRAHIQAIHMRVALLLQVEAEITGGAAARMSRDRLQNIVDAVLKEDEFDDDERADLVKRIVDAAEKRLVFLVEPEPGSFGFEIRSLQEFMAAWALTEGGDASVISRLLQVAKAPLFRNVVLFMASKLFSERSALRDILADRVCGTLDQDPSDALARTTKAGSLLALDVLEEGSALSQPKRARALMERAVGLLELPPAAQHARLTRVVTDDTAPILRAAIEARLARSVKDDTVDTLAMWICVLEATNREQVWAEQVGEAFWSSLKEPACILIACNIANISLGRWIVSKIEAAPESFPPESLISFSGVSGIETASAASGWVEATVRMFNYARRQRDLRGDGFFFFSPLPSPNTIQLSLSALAAMRSPPQDWRAWVSAAKFYGTPSADLLAETLRIVADTLSREKWHRLSTWMPWPLAACLSAAKHPAELLHFADMLSGGELGDSADWYQAEQSWSTASSPHAVIDALVDGLPWTLASLKVAPPLAAVSLTFVQQPKLKETHSLLEHAALAFRSCHSSIHREQLASTCLNLLHYLPANYRIDPPEMSEWIEVSAEGFSYTYSRPRHISIEEWVRAIQLVGHHNVIYILHEPARAINAYLENSENQGLLYLVGRALCRLTASTFPANLRIRLKQVMAAHSYATRPANVDAAVLRLWLGSVSDTNTRDIIRDVLVEAEHEHDVPYQFLAAITNGDLPEVLRESLLLQCYMEMRALRWWPSEAIEALRGVLQSRRSGLGSPTTWDRLELPLPHPLVPAAAVRRTAVPEKPVVLRELHVQHIRGIGDLKLKFEPPPPAQGQWIVFLGPNGAGKTTLLRSLVIALRNLRDPKIWPKGTFAIPWNEIAGPGEATIRVQFVDQGEHTTRIRSNGSETLVQTPQQEEPRLFPIFAYGCRRGSALGGVAREVDLGDDDGPEVATLFDEGASLIHAETWLIGLDGDAQKKAESKAVFEVVREALKSLLALKSIEVRDQKVWVSERGGLSIPLKALSDGYTTTAGWFLDLIARWIPLAERYGVPVDANFMQRMTGLVLLDEIDLHLHPRWQTESIERTRRLLPNMSFVVTTHNPLTLVGAKPEEIWILTLDGGRVRAAHGTEAPMLLTGGQIYSRYFGIQDIHPQALGTKLRRYGFLSGYALRDDAEQVEMETLRDELRRAGIDPGWEEVPREFLSAVAPSTKAKKPAAQKVRGKAR